jgi:hypothetical protein
VRASPSKPSPDPEPHRSPSTNQQNPHANPEQPAEPQRSFNEIFYENPETAPRGFGRSPICSVAAILFCDAAQLCSGLIPVC